MSDTLVNEDVHDEWTTTTRLRGRRDPEWQRAGRPGGPAGQTPRTVRALRQTR